MVYHLVYHFFEVGHFVYRYPKSKRWRPSWQRKCITTLRKRQSNLRSPPSLQSHLFASYYTFCFVQSSWLLSARNTDIIPINSNTNIFLFINHNTHNIPCCVPAVFLTPSFLSELNFLLYMVVSKFVGFFKTITCQRKWGNATLFSGN